jgi:hypothetical protein
LDINRPVSLFGQPSNITWYAASRQFSWRLEYGTTPMPNNLASFLCGGSFWFAGNLPFPSGPTDYAVVVGAKWGDGDVDRTMLLVYDPGRLT